MGEDTITAGELAERSGVTIRTVQYWTASDLLRAVDGTKHAGTGKHRQYSESELRIALALARLADLGISIGELRHVAHDLRSTEHWPRYLGLVVEDGEMRTILTDDVLDLLAPDAVVIVKLSPGVRLRAKE